MKGELNSLDDEAVDLRRVLRHHDPLQLWYQIKEIVDDRIYLRHGVELAPGAVVLDVGANVGVAAAFFASECRAGLIHSFEPVPPLYELLCANVSRFRACVAHPYGLSSRPGASTITYYPGAAAMSGLHADPDADREHVRRVMTNLGRTAEEADRELEGRYRAETLSCELRTLSAVLGELALERVDLLKVDVEKAELDVLEGIGESDWPRIMQLVVEVHDEGGRLAAIAGSLEGRGFSVTIDQEAELRGTQVHLLYATRPGDSGPTRRPGRAGRPAP